MLFLLKFFSKEIDDTIKVPSNTFGRQLFNLISLFFTPRISTSGTLNTIFLFIISESISAALPTLILNNSFNISSVKLLVYSFTFSFLIISHTSCAFSSLNGLLINAITLYASISSLTLFFTSADTTNTFASLLNSFISFSNS